MTPSPNQERCCEKCENFIALDGSCTDCPCHIQNHSTMEGWEEEFDNTFGKLLGEIDTLPKRYGGGNDTAGILKGYISSLLAKERESAERRGYTWQIRRSTDDTNDTLILEGGEPKQRITFKLAARKGTDI